MLIITYQKKRYKFNPYKLLKNILTTSILIVFITMSVYVCKFPAKFSTTYRYQLKNEISNGDEEAIEYYNRVYKANGINLFED